MNEQFLWYETQHWFLSDLLGSGIGGGFRQTIVDQITGVYDPIAGATGTATVEAFA